MATAYEWMQIREQDRVEKEMKTLQSTKIKSLTTQIEKFKLEFSAKHSEFKLMKEELELKETHLKKMQADLQALKEHSDELIISEHALLRYLERVYKLDLAKLTKEIVPEHLNVTIADLGNGEYHTGDGYSVKVVDNVVVTILDEELRHPTKSMKQKRKTTTHRFKKPSYEPTIKEYLEDIA